MFVEKMVLNKDRNVTLVAYLQEGERDRPAMIVLPGGAYAWCSPREADPVCQAYLQAGYHVFVLYYSVNQHAHWPNPLEDYDMAMAYIRNHAKVWHIYEDKIAVIGFSAGGHLAAAAATMSKNRPNAALLGYAVCSEDVKACNSSAPDATQYVDIKTCPCFIFSSRSDNVVPIHNSLAMMEALDRYQIAFESHIYAYGPHGFSTVASVIQDPKRPICNRTKNWVSDSIEWLKDMFGDFGATGMSEPNCAKFISDDYEAYLSLDCTLGHLYENKKARELLESVMPQPTSLEHAKRMTLRGVLGFSTLPSETVNELARQLSQIENENPSL